jgi:hypothetical protein
MRIPENFYEMSEEQQLAWARAFRETLTAAAPADDPQPEQGGAAPTTTSE